MTKEYFRMTMLTLIVIVFFQFFPALFAQEMQVLDQVVAVVDNEVILLSELRQQALSYAMQYGINPQTQPDKFNELMQQVLDNMVTQKILYVKGIEDSVIVEDRVVEDELERRIAMMVQQYGSREKVKENFGSSIEKIKRDFADEARQGIMAQMVMGQKEAQLKVTRREVEDFYRSMKDSLPDLPETFHIANLLLQIKPGEIAEKKARDRMNEMAAQLKSGTDFAQLARDFSDDPASASQGGELGFFQRGELVKDFEEVAFQLKEGETSDVVKTSYGLHIIQLVERQGEKVNCRHILAALEPTLEDEKLIVEQIKEIHGKIKSGENSFEEMVGQYSEDVSSKENQGDLGWWEKEMIQPKEFKWVVESLQAGEVSEPVKTKLGYHILKLLAKNEPRPLDINQDWERIEAFALQIKKQRELKKWVEKLKSKVYINIKDVSIN